MHAIENLVNYTNIQALKPMPQAEKSKAILEDILASYKKDNPAKSADPVVSSAKSLLSPQNDRMLLEDQERSGQAGQGLYTLDTGAGKELRDLDDFYSTEKPKPIPGNITVRSVADTIMTPSANNVRALSDHVSQRMQDLLSAHNIPEAPASVKFDSEGTMVLPDDYQYADEFKAALAKDPGFEREMSDLNAITSHFVELQRLARQENQATAEKDKAALMEKMKAQTEQKFFSVDTGRGPNTALEFDADGVLTMTENGQEISYKLT